MVLPVSLRCSGRPQPGAGGYPHGDQVDGETREILVGDGIAATPTWCCLVDSAERPEDV